MLFSDIEDDVSKAKSSKVTNVSAKVRSELEGTEQQDLTEIANVKLSVLRKKSVLNFAIPKMEVKPVSQCSSPQILPTTQTTNNGAE